MRRGDLQELATFIAVAEAKSFTRAAATLGVSPSALSHAIKGLEARLGLMLLARTTRTVSTTEVGERLLRAARPAFQSIESELISLRGMREEPSGTVRLTTFKHAATSVVMPLLPGFLADHPHIRVELVVDDVMTDIVADRFDAGIRFGESVARDMTSVQVGPEFTAVVVGAPDYFASAGKPRKPRDLAMHRCIVHRVSEGSAASSWPFQERSRPVSVKVEGPLVFNDVDLVLQAALAGQGLAYLLADQVKHYLRSGALQAVLQSFVQRSSGYFLYFPNGHQPSPALGALIEALTHQTTPAWTDQPRQGSTAAPKTMRLIASPKIA